VKIPMLRNKKTVVVGLGNILMADEGVGIYVVRELITHADNLINVDFVELGSSVMSVIHVIAGRNKAVLVDCAYMNEPTGTIRKFTPEDVVSRKHFSGFSMHEGDLIKIIHLSRQLGECPEEIAIFGIQPERIAPCNTLSNTLNCLLKHYVDVVASELA